MSGHDESDRLRGELLQLLAEDAHNTERLLGRLDAITRESGVGAHAALLLILTHLAFDEDQARQHWQAILTHRRELSAQLGRDVRVRTALLDYFLNINRRLVSPTLVDLEMYESGTADAGRDDLTGLVSDRRFRSGVQRELRRARRYEQKASVVLVDVDDFAGINARFGELIGDRLLRELAILLNNNVRDIDLAGRPGEDEMAVLLPETDRNGALLVAERFRREVETFFAAREAAGKAVLLTISAGVACYPDDASTPEGLFLSASQALYGAKSAGRNAVRPFHPERRRYLRFDLEPGRFEVEVLSRPERDPGRLRNLSRNGILFTSPEPLEVGEQIEIRMADHETEPRDRTLRIRGRVVRLEELPHPELRAPGARGEDDRWEVGVAFDFDWAEGTDDLLEFLERAQAGRMGRKP